MPKDSKTTFADIIHESLEFDPSNKADSLVLELIDTSWVQRLRDVSQTGNTRLVYMFSEHSRFGHSLEVAYLSLRLLSSLKKSHKKEVEEYELAIAAAGLLHDIAHIAPGSHTALQAWFPNEKDNHEATAGKIISEEKEFSEILEKYETGLTQKVSRILLEDKTLPSWTWQVLSAGGWNVDRGSWCIADSILAGVSYGKYNIAALTDSITISKESELALKENRLDAMLHFAMSRHAMYKQIYQHRVLLATDKLIAMLVKRCRAVSSELYFCDDVMLNVLSAKSAKDLNNSDIFKMRESWWRYHLIKWCESKDEIIADISNRLLNRKLLKTVAILDSDNKDQLYNNAKKAVEDSGFNPEYYLYKISSVDMFKESGDNTIKVLKEDGSCIALNKADSMFQTILKDTVKYSKDWIVLPKKAKELLGRSR